MIKGKGTEEDPLMSRPMSFIRLSVMRDKETDENRWVLILSDDNDDVDFEKHAIALTDVDMDDLIEAYYAAGG